MADVTVLDDLARIENEKRTESGGEVGNHFQTESSISPARTTRGAKKRCEWSRHSREEWRKRREHRGEQSTKQRKWGGSLVEAGTVDWFLAIIDHATRRLRKNSIPRRPPARCSARENKKIAFRCSRNFMGFDTLIGSLDHPQAGSGSRIDFRERCKRGEGVKRSCVAAPEDFGPSESRATTTSDGWVQAAIDQPFGPRIRAPLREPSSPLLTSMKCHPNANSLNSTEYMDNYRPSLNLLERFRRTQHVYDPQLVGSRQQPPTN
uniref:Uncharacterized protein n=1 Tax=Steinernema glaseri TaxID=37863 RepID=A0A1I7XX99_9BILA